MAKAERARRLQEIGHSLQGETVLAHSFGDEQSLPHNLALYSQRVWSPQGVGEQGSQLLTDNFDRSGPVSNCNPNLSIIDLSRPLQTWRPRPMPEATFMPTVAGLWPREVSEPDLSDHMKALIAQAILKGITTGLQQGNTPALLPLNYPQPQ